MTNKKFIYIIAVLITIIILLTIKISFDYDKLKSYESQIFILKPKYSDKDTIQLLNLILNLEEFDWDTKLLDTSRRIVILQYPYINNKYNLIKFNKQVAFYEGGPSTIMNQFMFHVFDLYQNDSAYIFFEFSENRGGSIKAKKVYGKWKIIDYGIGRF